MPEWTDKRVQTLIEKFNAGISAGQIAKVLGVSRSAVLGKIDRLRRSPATGARIRRGRSGPSKPQSVFQQKEADQRSLYILQRRDDDKASFTSIGNELGISSQTARRQYQQIIAAANAEENNHGH